MNLMGYDAMALGPEELSLGGVTLRQRLEEAQFPIVSANVLWSGTDEPVTQPYAVLMVGSHRVAVIGLTRSPAEELVNFRILDPKEALAEYMPEVSAVADTVVLLTNLGYRQVFEFVRTVPGIDLVVAALPRQLPENAVRIPETGTLVLTAEQPLPKHTGRRVGRLVATLGSDGGLDDESWTSVSMGPEFVDHPGMKALLDRYQ